MAGVLGSINLARLDVGNPVSARLLGEITIHRPNAAAKGEEDDSLWLVTRNLKVSQTQIITPQPVEFRLGPHWGYGEDLEIELTIPSKRRDKKAAFGRIKNLTLHRLERVMLVTDDGFLRRAGIRTDVTGGDDSTRGDEETGGDVHAAARLRIAERRSDSEDEPPKKKTPIDLCHAQPALLQTSGASIVSRGATASGTTQRSRRGLSGAAAPGNRKNWSNRRQTRALGVLPIA